MYYPDELVEEIREKNDIVSVVGEYVKLTRKGGSYFGLCPFHNEKTGSFSVSPQKQIYYCFGCHKGGNVFSFLMDYENYTFPEAVKVLGERVGVDLPEIEYSESEKQKKDENGEKVEVVSVADELFPYEGDAKQQFNQKILAKINEGKVTTNTYDGNLEDLGYIDVDNPSSISIYPKDFEMKESVAKLINEAENPFIYAGGGVIASGAYEELKEMVDKINFVLVLP